MKHKTQAIQKAPRQSNMELLRIVAMAFVVLVHTDFWALGAPTPELITAEPSKAFMQYVVEAISIVSVNCFIFISGWFGIKPKWRSFCGLLFQILFFSFFIYFVFIVCGLEKFSYKSFLNHSNFLKLWFIPPYIAIYWLSPMINTFIEKADKKTVVQVLIAFVILDISLGWMKDYLHFHMVYSLLNFMLIYIIARFINHHRPCWSKHKKIIDLYVYLLSCFSIVSILYLIFFIKPSLLSQGYRIFHYNSPFVIISTISLCLFFTKIQIKSRFVNWMATSCFSVYLLHQDSFVGDRLMKSFCNEMFISNNILVYSMLMIALVAMIYIFAILIDQIRLFLWSKVFIH